MPRSNTIAARCECQLSEIQKAASLFNPRVLYHIQQVIATYAVLGIIPIMFTSNHYSINLLDIPGHSIHQRNPHPSSRQYMNPQPLGITKPVVGALDLSKHALRLRLLAP